MKRDPGYGLESPTMYHLLVVPPYEFYAVDETIEKRGQVHIIELSVRSFIG